LTIVLISTACSSDKLTDLTQIPTNTTPLVSIVTATSEAVGVVSDHTNLHDVKA